MLRPPVTDSRERPGLLAVAYDLLQSALITLQSSPSTRSATLSPGLSNSLLGPVVANHGPMHALGRSPCAGTSSKPTHSNAVRYQIQGSPSRLCRPCSSRCHCSKRILSCFPVQTVTSILFMRFPRFQSFSCTRAAIPPCDFQQVGVAVLNSSPR